MYIAHMYVIVYWNTCSNSANPKISYMPYVFTAVARHYQFLNRKYNIYYYEWYRYEDNFNTSLLIAIYAWLIMYWVRYGYICNPYPYILLIDFVVNVANNTHPKMTTFPSSDSRWLLVCQSTLFLKYKNNLNGYYCNVWRVYRKHALA
jgi:hypothetical protein